MQVKSTSGERRFFRPLGGDERKSFRIHLLSAVFGGISMGVVINHEYIAVNGLNASHWQITALTMLWPVSNLLAVLINHWLDSRGRYDRAVLVFGVLSRLPVALMFFSSNVNLMLLLLFFFFASNSVILPAQNSIMRSGTPIVTEQDFSAGGQAYSHSSVFQLPCLQALCWIWISSTTEFCSWSKRFSEREKLFSYR